jgi:hypothetical protein
MMPRAQLARHAHCRAGTARACVLLCKLDMRSLCITRLDKRSSYKTTHAAVHTVSTGVACRFSPHHCNCLPSAQQLKRPRQRQSAFTRAKLLLLPPSTESSSMLPPKTAEPPPKRPAIELTPTPVCAEGASVGAKRGYKPHATSAIQSDLLRPYSKVSCLKCMDTMQ